MNMALDRRKSGEVMIAKEYHINDQLIIVEIILLAMNINRMGKESVES